MSILRLTRTRGSTSGRSPAFIPNIYLPMFIRNRKVTFANDDVALEVNSIAFRKFEHRVKLGFGRPLKSVVLELGQDVGIWTTEKMTVRSINTIIKIQMIKLIHLKTLPQS